MDYVKNDKIAAKYLRRVMSFQQEEFWVIALHSNQKIIASSMIFLGTVDKCLIHPRDIFRFAISKNASRIIISHSHPAGETQPSEEDISTTKRLHRAGETLGIPIVDHIIMTKHSHFSFARQKLIFSPN